MQGNSRAQAVTLKLPTRPGNRDGAPGSKSGACAPTHHRRAKAPTGGKQVDRPAVLAKTEAAGTRCQMRVVASQPGWRHESCGMKLQTVQPLQRMLESISGGGALEGQEFSLAGCPAPRPPVISPPAAQSDLIVALAMQDELGSLRSTLLQPADESGIALEWPAAM